MTESANSPYGQKFIVGEPYSKARRVWEARDDFSVQRGIHNFRLFAKGLTARDIDAFRKGNIHFGLMPAGPVFFLVYRIEGYCDWSDISYWQGFIHEDERALPDADQLPGDMALISTFLVNADTGILEAMRFFTLSANFTRVLHERICQQIAEMRPKEEVMAAIHNALRRFPKSKAMWPYCVVQERGGMPRI